MYVDQLFALRSGVFRLPDGQPGRFKAHELGELHIRSGIAAVCDPLLLQTPGMINGSREQQESVSEGGGDRVRVAGARK
ncbi:hypothetical protein GA0061084_0981 [Arthrobacter sp. NIO-1057]|nr:hypothetical protein GA0061084_0981 [Arthrobacter sp. NIO-1057]